MVACTGPTLNVVAAVMSIPFPSAEVVVEREGDLRSTLRTAEEVPIRSSTFAASGDPLAALLKLTGRY